MLDLDVAVTGAAVDPYAAVPTISLDLQVHEATGAQVAAVLLRAQVRIEARRRSYTPGEEERLVDLFGPPHQWSTSLQTFLWTELVATVGAFASSTSLRVPLACSYDLEVVAGRYLDGLQAGTVPLRFLFSGTAFGAGPGRVLVEPVPWHVESSFALPVALWREAMDRYFPDSGWLRLPRRSIDALGAYKSRLALPSFADALDALLVQTGERV